MGTVLDEDDEGDLPFGEVDPEERWGNPEEDLVDVPEVEPPTVRNPADDLPDATEVDSEIQSAFWGAVVYANVALLGVSLGLMLVGFRGQWRWGGAAVLVGVLAAFRTYQTYRAFRNRDPGEDVGGSSGTEPDDEP